MKTNLKRLSLLPILFLSIISLSFAFSAKRPIVTESAISPITAVASALSRYLAVYDSLELGQAGLSREAFEYAVRGAQQLDQEGKLANDSIITIVDFSQSSCEKRLYIVDVENAKVLFNTYVAHGRNSGKNMATSFSNIMSSFQSSLGFYVTGNTYMGGNGYSLKLHGMEKGINDRANDRAIVMHGAPYVSESFIRTQGYLGRSWGCPAVSNAEARPIINAIKDGTCLFIYSPDKQYSTRSGFLKGLVG